MERENIEKLIKVLGIIMLVSLGLKVLGFLLSLVFGITTFLLMPLLLLILVCGVPILAIYGLYKLVTRNNDVW
ncbi:MAG: hypothetical protein SOW41_01705 [Anaerococcus sp.]|nr:hypothetical protein [Peptoniphilaceae bacterium]MDY3054760.1 hypothetical protein [Anaerococcus sp.]